MLLLAAGVLVAMSCLLLTLLLVLLLVLLLQGSYKTGYATVTKCVSCTEGVTTPANQLNTLESDCKGRCKLTAGNIQAQRSFQQHSRASSGSVDTICCISACSSKNTCDNDGCPVAVLGYPFMCCTMLIAYNSALLSQRSPHVRL